LNVEFGVFDHLDRDAASLPEQYECRLKLVELYDRLGFYAYHVAEHHSTPLGTAPSPGVYLASVIQRTKRLKIGPLVYLLPLYHPLRLVEEVCMLDNLSGGRMQLGVGRGISPIELGFYGCDSNEAKDIYQENLSILLLGLSSDRLSYEGRFHRFTDVPLPLRPVQRPHPPVWMGISSAESAELAGRNGYNIVGLMPASAMRSRVDRYRQALQADNRDSRKAGISYLTVVGEDDSSAMHAADAAYSRWHASFHHLYRLQGRQPVLGAWPDAFHDLVKQERAIAGSPETVTAFLRRQVEVSGINYVVAQLMFGDLPFETACRSVTLFAQEVMPRLR
jgi:alkanesulfonate monooxygenase SsuD/methylene tetrahydromethanopterin reductase-like flavin-dependent oxidoreductase (luciferase family)